MVGYALAIQRGLQSFVDFSRGAGREDDAVGLAHPARDLDDPLRGLAQAEDHLGEAAAQIAVRIELRETQVLVREGPKAVHGLSDGEFSRLQVSEEGLDTFPIHGLTGSVPTSRARARS